MTREDKRIYTFEELLERDGRLVYTNVGISMLPLLRQHRDVIEIRKKDPSVRCRKYDVVLYKYGKKYVMHRILKVREKDYVICGDHNIWREYGITDERILGIMTRLVRNGKTITPENFWYKVYVHIWCDFYHVRAFILYTKRLVWSIGHRIKIVVKKALS